MKSKTKTEPWKEAQPFLKDAASSLQGAYGANAGNIQGVTDQITGLAPEFVSRFNEGDAGVNAGRDYGIDVLSGEYLGGNPFTSEMIDLALNEGTNATQAALGKRGLTGGSDYANIIAKQNANTALGYRFNDYNNERGRMDAAASRAPGFAAADYLPIQSLLGSASASTLPVQAAAGYAGGLGGLFGGTGKTTQNPGLFGGLLGVGGLGLGAYDILR